MGEASWHRGNSASIQKHHVKPLQPAKVLSQDKKTLFSITICFEFQHLPRNNGRHLPNNPPPPRKKRNPNNREIPPPGPPPSPKPTVQHTRARLEGKAGGRKRGEVWRGKGVRKRGRERRRAEGRRQNSRRGKVTKSRENGKTLTIDMNEDGPIVSRDEQRNLTTYFFFLTRRPHCNSIPTPYWAIKQNAPLCFEELETAWGLKRLWNIYSYVNSSYGLYKSSNYYSSRHIRVLWRLLDWWGRDY